MKKNFFLTMVASLLLSFVFSTLVYSEEHEVQLQDEEEYEETAVEISENMEQMMQAQEGAVAANEVLMEYFYQGRTEPVYPDYFSGRYIEDNVLYVCYAGELEEVEEELTPVFGDLVTYVKYERRNYSYNYLVEYLETALVNIEAQGGKIRGYGINEKENKAFIYVKEETLQNVEEIYYSTRQMKADRIIIDKVGEVELATSVYGGGNITIQTSIESLRATLGICGTYKGRPAFLLNGHNLTDGSSVYYAGALLGTIEVIQCTHNEEGDYAIGYISNTSIFSPTHKVKNGDASYLTLTGGTFNYPAIGTIVSRYGSVTGLTYGTITKALGSFPFGDAHIVGGICEVEPSGNYSALSGDSGGPYWSNGRFLGTHTGVDTTNGKWYFSLYRLAEAEGFTAYASHQISSWSNYSSMYHRGYCSICQIYVSEAHAGYLNSSGVCIRCGYGGPSVAE